MKKIIIIGAGFAGLSASKRLSGSGLALEVTLFDKKEQFNFLPLIPDCIGRGINPELLVNDVANLCRKTKVKFIQQEVTAIDLSIGQVWAGSTTYAYDYLIIASGSQPNFFSNPDAQAYGHPLNSVMDIQGIISRLKENNFKDLIICGAGYTGIEAATNLWLYLKKNGIHKKIIIVERAPAVLGVLPDWMKDYVVRNLKNMEIEVLTNSVIEKIWPDKLLVSGGREFPRPMLIWVPGVKTAEFIQKLDIPKNPQGRIIVDEYLRARGNCFCAGDTAFFGKKNNSLRMAIQFAITQGDQAAGNIIRSIKNTPLKKYRPLDLGYIIPMANNKSCGRVLGLRVSGYFATFLHFSMCIFRSVGWKNKVGIIKNLVKSLLVLIAVRQAAGNRRRWQMLDWGILILRLGIGIMFTAHGLQKTFGFFGGPGINGFSQMLSGLGFVPAVPWAYLAAYTELLGGVFLILGLFTRASGALLLILIVTAAMKVHLSKGFFLSNGGIEYTLVIAAVCLSLILLGPGKFSIFH